MKVPFSYKNDLLRLAFLIIMFRKNQRTSR